MSVPLLQTKIEANRLLGEWEQRLERVARQQGKAAYAFVMGSCAELLSAFDIPLVLPEVTCLQTAIAGSAPALLRRAEEAGYPSDICNYLKADAGLHLGGRQLPQRSLPAPCLAIATSACNTYIKWAEIWQRLYGMPLTVLDIPGSRTPGRPDPPGTAGFERDLTYLTAQLCGLIRRCEELTGKPLDQGRLSHALDCTNQMSRDFSLMLALNRSGSTGFDAVRHGGACLGVFNAYRGTEAGVRFFRDAVEELQRQQAEAADQPLPEPDFRLLFAGLPCYPLYSEFIRMFHGKGGRFVASTYLQFASGGGCLGYQFDPDRPVESLAEGLLVTTREAMEGMFLPGDRLLELQRAYRLDGIVFHAVKSCRTVSTGLADARRRLLSRSSIPTLLLESDMMDRRLVSPAQMQNRIEAFFESLRLRRKATAP